MIYKVVTSQNLAILEQEVTANLNNGWVLSGGIFSDSAYYYPAMVYQNYITSGFRMVKLSEEEDKIKP